MPNLGNVRMFITPLNRLRLLTCFPKGGIAAELGVDRGGFSQRILDLSEPSKLHLIDPWGGADNEYVATYQIQGAMEDRFQAVSAKFADHVAREQVVIHRDYSYNVFPAFEDNYFDWAYVDGMHTYEAVIADLRLVDNKVKADGFILGHDFSNTGRKDFGVIQAVREFLRERPVYELICFTNENAPTFVIAKNPAADTTRVLREAIISASPRITEIDFAALDMFRQIQIMTAGGRSEYVFRFEAT